MKQPRRTHYFDSTDDDVLLWKVSRLWELAAALPVDEVPLAELAHVFDAQAYLSGLPVQQVDGTLPTLREVATYAKDSYKTDLSYPIILSAEGNVMDGKHRLCKAWMLGLPTIAVVRFRQTPDPDERRPKRRP